MYCLGHEFLTTLPVVFHVSVTTSWFFLLLLCLDSPISAYHYSILILARKCKFCRCFLSDEAQFIANIIEDILQCALDFRSCLTRGVWDITQDQGDLLGSISRINISQVILASFYPFCLNNFAFQHEWALRSREGL